ncbi:unnamed protein product [Caenorhabditis angaria]|uniref:Cns1/TTC4 wheel domain-containing protein n=1 Tax=Caenorhabditis angaria TaxID=860376 RepID=A0A9P1MV95_9PELO|nr:unnamed protein product [Caenorhabditis angaria]
MRLARCQQRDTIMELPKKKYTTEERAALTKKLDDELEQFMEEMAARKAEKSEPKKPFDFDEWCKEIDQHPAFMTELKSTDGKYHDTIEALQAMKYNKEDDEDLQMNAEHHKNEGNKHFKFKKYRWAIDAYTNGLKEKCADKKLNAILHFNCAAAHKHIGNLRSAIKSCSMGRKFDPTNLKGVVRGAECLLELEYGRDALEWIETSKKMFAFVKETSEDSDLNEDEKKFIEKMEELRKKAVELSLLEERNLRKSKVEERKDIESKRKLLDALKSRNLNLSPRLPFDYPELMDNSRLTVSLSFMKKHEIVQFDDENNLIWPILLQYPEVGQIDVLTETCEKTTVGELLQAVLDSPAEWDKEHVYKFENVRFFIADQYDEYLMEVYEWNDFGSVLSTPGYQIKQGLPVIMIFTHDKIKKSLIASEEYENRFTVV